MSRLPKQSNNASQGHNSETLSLFETKFKTLLKFYAIHTYTRTHMHKYTDI